MSCILVDDSEESQRAFTNTLQETLDSLSQNAQDMPVREGGGGGALPGFPRRLEKLEQSYVRMILQGYAQNENTLAT